MTINFAIPSKGRLAEGARDWLHSLDIRIINISQSRGYSGQLKGEIEANLLLLSASEIPEKLADGSLNFAITGMDVVRENIAGWRASVDEVTQLGLGGTNLVISVPKFWIDAETLEDLDAIAAQFRRKHGRRLKIATKYTNLVREFLGEAGVVDYQLAYSQGATEGAVANNFADAIADLVSTGKTLEANGLKPLPGGIILRSEAALFQSRICPIPQQSRDQVDHFVRRARDGSS